MKNNFIPFFCKWKIILVAILFISGSGCQVEVPKFHDYEAAIDYAKRIDKPTLIVFTAYGLGYNEFDNDYLSSWKLSNFLNRNFIVIEMIVDDRRVISEEHKHRMLGKFKIKTNPSEIKNLGHLNTAIQIFEYKTNSQPLYVVLDTQEQLLIEPFGYQGSNSKFYNKLQLALANFKKTH